MKRNASRPKTQRIRAEFLRLKASRPKRLERRLELSWSNWGFGIEECWRPTRSGVTRQRSGIGFASSSHRKNRYGPDSANRAEEAEARCLAGRASGPAAGGRAAVYVSPTAIPSSERGPGAPRVIDYMRRNGGT